MPSESLKFNTDDVKAYAEILVHAATVAPALSRAVVAKGALNIKTDARRIIGHPAHAPSYASSITYDSHETATSSWAEIGPDKSKRQGALGNLLEYGSVNNDPIPHMAPAAQLEQPKFEKAMADLAAKLLA